MANHQLVVTKQAKQANCPLSGGPCKTEFTAKVGGVDVYFCCPNCQGKVAKTEGEAQIAMVFGDKAFEKAYKVGEEGRREEGRVTLGVWDSDALQLRSVPLGTLFFCACGAANETGSRLTRIHAGWDQTAERVGGATTGKLRRRPPPFLIAAPTAAGGGGGCGDEGIFLGGTG